MVARFRFDRYTDETITTSLYYLRAQIVRNGQEGLEHVDALLRLQGREPEAFRVPPKVHRHFRRRELRVGVLEALKGGPLTTSEIADAMEPTMPHLKRRDRYNRVYACLVRSLAMRGMVRREKDRLGRYVWNLVQ